jgi:hypothetical protein
MAIQETRTLPAPFVDKLGTDLATQITAQAQIPVVAPGAGGITQLAGESAEDFSRRQQAAQQFDIRQQSLAGLAPQVAGLSQLEQDARTRAQAGLASFQPFLTAAQQQATAAETGLGAIPLGAPTTQQVTDFMSPFQAQVIDATLSEFDRNRDIQEQRLRDQQAALGVLGSGRAGVQLAEFGTGAARERALLNAQLLQQGFGQAMGARQQDIANRFGVAGAQQGLGQFQTGLASLVPQLQRDRYAAQVTGLMGGYPGGTRQEFVPQPTPLQSALGIATTLGGLYLGSR